MTPSCGACRCSRVGPGHPIADQRRLRARLQGHGVKDVVHALVDQLPVAVHVHQVQQELAIPLGRHQEVLFAQRIGRVVRRKVAAAVIVGALDRIDRPVADFGPRDVGRDLGDPVREIVAGVRIDDAQRAAEPVVMGAAREHHAAAAGDAAGVLHQVRPDALVAPVVQHLGAVGIDRPQFLGPPQRLVRVFPAGVDHPAVGHQRGQIIRLVVRRDQVHVLPVPVAARQDEGVRGRHAAARRCGPASC